MMAKIEAVKEKPVIEGWLPHEQCCACGETGTYSLTGGVRYSAPAQLEVKCANCGAIRWATLVSLWEAKCKWVDWV